MQNDIDRILISRDVLAKRIKQLAATITQDFLAADPATEITIVPILTGSFIFVADLIRQLPMKMQIRLLSVSSYPGTSTVSRGAKILSDLAALAKQVHGAHVLVVDDILDSGQTLNLVCEQLREMSPKILKTCVLLRKKTGKSASFESDYVAFDVPDEFVVGYGLDFDDYYRNLPDIVVLRPNIFQAKINTPQPDA